MKLNLIIAFITVFCHSLFAQTTLYAKPTQRVQAPLLGGGAVAWLEPSKAYKVMGLDRENHLLIQHEAGLAISPDNYRILDGGSFSDSAPITVSKPSFVIKPYYGAENSIYAEYEAELSTLIPKLYVAFQIYVNGEPYSAYAMAVTNKHFWVNDVCRDVQSNARITYDVHYYINGKEIRTVEAIETPKSNNNPKW